LEGLVWRIRNTQTGDSTDIDEVTENIAERYKLDAVMSEEPWAANLSPITRHTRGLAVNYAVLYAKLAEHRGRTGNINSAVEYYRKAFEIAEHSDHRSAMKQILESWVRLAPDDVDVQTLRREHAIDL